MRIAYQGVLYKVVSFQTLGDIRFLCLWSEKDPNNIEWIPIDDPDLMII